jgi:hypothetical protein
MTRTITNVLALMALTTPTVLVAGACGGGKPAEAPPMPSISTPASMASSEAMASASASAAPAETSTASAAPAAGTPGPLASILTSDASTIQRLFDDASHAPAATLKGKEAAGGDPLAKGLRDFAKKAAPGMEPDGPLATGSLKEKQNLQTEVTLRPGKCYTIVGYSKKVKDLDLYLLLAPGILSGQDTTDDSTPVIGAAPQPMCPIATTAVTYKLDIVADQGAGEIAVQLFSKGK